jgi:hypothetical protein
VDGCITMKQIDGGGTEKLNWTQHPNNPMRKAD